MSASIVSREASEANSLDSTRRRDPQPPAKVRRESWIGVDFAPLANAPSSRSFIPLLVLALIVALGVASLRIDLIRTRYALAEAMAAEQTLIEEQRALIVRQRRLRDPAVLATLAAERGYRSAESVRTMPDPMPATSFVDPGLPAVGSGPPREDLAQ
jgi:hypothetical protein